MSDRAAGNSGGLDGAAVLVTGAGGDIGATYVRAFAAAGAQVIAADLPFMADAAGAAARAATEAGPGTARFVACDVTDDASLVAAVGAATDEFGGLDVLVNNAALYKALGAKRPLTDLGNEEFDRVMTVNVRGTWQAMKAAVPAMRARGGGRIVNVSSVVARTGPAGFAHYVASKAAVDGLTRAAARELGPDGITVNAVAPGLVTDDATRTLNDAGYVARASMARALGREMQPDDLVGAVLWLASPGSAFVTGQVLIVDGGAVFG